MSVTPKRAGSFQSVCQQPIAHQAVKIGLLWQRGLMPTPTRGAEVDKAFKLSVVLVGSSPAWLWLSTSLM
jgi:hypothetical protein